MYCYIIVLVTLLPSLSWQVNEANREVNLRGSLSFFPEAITKTRECALDGGAWVDICMSLGKHVPLGRLQKHLQRLRKMYFVQPVP
jgi:hypothetical protein